MKHLILIILATVLNINAFAQIFECGFSCGAGPATHGEKRAIIDFSMQAGAKWYNNLALGGFYTLFTSSAKEDYRFQDLYEDYKFRFRGVYGGFYVEKCVFNHSFFSVNVGSKLGFGAINYSNDQRNLEDYDDEETAYWDFDKLDRSFVMALKPYISADFELNDEFTLSAVTEYRTLNCIHLNYDNCNIASGSSLNGYTFLVKMSVHFD